MRILLREEKEGGYKFDRETKKVEYLARDLFALEKEKARQTELDLEGYKP